MTNSAELLALIQRDPDLQARLAATGEFDVRRAEPDPEARVSSGARLECVAGDFTGGAFFLCGDPEAVRPVLYASSEGEAGLIAADLTAALELFVSLPFWRDCLGYSGNGDLSVMSAAAALLRRDRLARDPDAEVRQEELARSLGLRPSPAETQLIRLHAAVAGSEPDYVFSDSTGEYDGLFGPFTPSRNSAWQ